MHSASHPTFEGLPAAQRGILLRLDDAGEVVLGALRFEHGHEKADGRFLERLRFVVSGATGVRCTRLDVSPGRPRVAPARKAPAGWVVTTFFEARVDRLFEGPPARPCFVYAFFGNHVSNVIRLAAAPGASP